MQPAARDVLERPLVGEGEDGEDEVDGLQDGDGLDGGVEVLGQEVEEEFRPEVGFEGRGDVVWRMEGDGQYVRFVSPGCVGYFDVQADAARTMSRAQWFLMSLPMLLLRVLRAVPVPPYCQYGGEVAARREVSGCYRAGEGERFIVSRVSGAEIAQAR